MALQTKLKRLLLLRVLRTRASAIIPIEAAVDAEYEQRRL